MTRGSNILLAALGGAVLGAVLANYLSTEKGREMLESASTTIKDLTGKAKEYANEVIRETKDSIGPVVREKLAEQVKK